MSELTHEGAYRLIHESRRTGAESAALRLHLRDCEECRRHAAMAALLARHLQLQPVRQDAPSAVRDAVLRAADRHVRRQKLLRPLAAAGALVALALIVLAGWNIIRSTTQITVSAEVDEYMDATLVAAVEAGDTIKVETLLRAMRGSSFRDASGTALLPLAARAGQLEMVRLLLENGAGVNDTMNPFGAGTTALIEAASEGHRGIVELLLSAGADANQRESGSGLAALHHASGPSAAKIVLALLENGADPNLQANNGWTPLHVAARLGYFNVSQELLNHGAEINAADNEGRTALMEAALNNRLELVELLITAGANANLQEKETGYTALHYASGQNHVEVVLVLLEQGADPNLQAAAGSTPLNIAARYGYVYTARALLEGGADVDLPDYEGLTPLMSSIRRGRVGDLALSRIVTLLLLRGADPNRQDGNGNTALHHAVEANMIDAIPILVEHGASLNIKNDEGQAPVDLARYGLTAQTLQAAAATVAQPGSE